jgi:hypothetical protein
VRARVVCDRRQSRLAEPVKGQSVDWLIFLIPHNR